MADESHNLRNPATPPSARRSLPPDDQSPTIRTTPVEVDLDALPEQASQYVAPQPLPRTSEHKTIDMVPVRLAPEINPRNALTQRLTPLPPHSPARGFLLGAAVAVLLLGALAVGAWRFLGDPSSVASPAGSSHEPASPLSVPGALELPAAAAIQEPAAIAPAPAEQAQNERPAKAASSTQPQKSQTKGREVWLE